MVSELDSEFWGWSGFTQGVQSCPFVLCFSQFSPFSAIMRNLTAIHSLWAPPCLIKAWSFSDMVLPCIFLEVYCRILLQILLRTSMRRGILLWPSAVKKKMVVSPSFPFFVCLHQFTSESKFRSILSGLKTPRWLLKFITVSKAGPSQNSKISSMKVYSLTRMYFSHPLTSDRFWVLQSQFSHWRICERNEGINGTGWFWWA